MPSTRCCSDAMRCSYELPHRIYTAQAYPVNAPNGSSIIIYGHETGVRILWRGGRPFKTQQAASSHSQKPNGTGDTIILLDSDEEDGGKQFEDKPEFEEDGDDFNPEKPYPSIRQTLDLYFGSDVLHIAILPELNSSSSKRLDSLKQNIVFAAACADGSVRLVTLPVVPPSPASKAREEFAADFTAAHAGKGKWGETVVMLSGHQKPSAGLSITLYTSEADTRKAPEIVVASHSREGTGLLLLWRAQVVVKVLHLEPSQKVNLASPAIRISFNPAVSGRISRHLLVADTTGACRIYDFVPAPDPSQQLEIEGTAAEHGSWLLALYVGFEKTDNPTTFLGHHSAFGRKTIIDANWVAQGRAIFVLLSNGEWGIWDIEGVRPNASQGLLNRQGVTGGSLTEFNLKGLIEGVAKVTTSALTQNSTSKFNPMTPGTRKMIDPFSSRGLQGPIRGSVSVLDIPSTSPTNPADESILIWLGDSFITIPSLSKYWAANGRQNAGGSSLFGNNPTGRMVKLEGITFQGERCSGICQIIPQNRNPSPSGLIADAIILGEHRFTILTPIRKEPSRPRSSEQTSMALVETSHNRGDLDVMEIDDVLDRMENGDRGVKRWEFGR